MSERRLVEAGCLSACFPGALLVLAVVCAVAGGSGGAGPEVTITGGGDETGHNYAWTITHNHRSPIVYVEFPHYRADLFEAPPGWATELTNPGGAGSDPSRCIATAASPDQGVQRRREAVFRVRVAPSGTPRGLGSVIVRFGDGGEVTVDGVSVPVRERFGDQYMALIGLGLIFGIFVVAKAIKGRKSKSYSTTGPNVAAGIEELADDTND